MRRRKSKGLSFYQKKKRINSSTMHEALSYVFITLAAVVVAFVLIYCVGMRTSVIGVAMQPTLSNGQQILVNRLLYRIVAPKSGDVVVFLPNGNTNAHYYVKRVVAVPGDDVQIKDGAVYVNGLKFKEYPFDKIQNAGIADELLTMQQDEFFVMGDNVNNSEDSRADNIGPVKRKDIYGKVWFHLGDGTRKMGLME